MSGISNMLQPRLLVCAGSARADSLHRQLAKAAEAALVVAGATLGRIVVVSLGRSATDVLPTIQRSGRAHLNQ